MAESGADIATLIRDHDEMIKEVLAEVNQTIAKDANLVRAAKEFPLDEFMTVKFLMSAAKKKNKQVRTATDNILETLAFRAEHHDLLRKGREAKTVRTLLPGQSGGWLGCELVIVVDFAKADLHEIARSFGSGDAALEHGLGLSESIRFILDSKSRETGKLHKVMSVLLLEGISLTKAANMTMIGVLGKISKGNEIRSPQTTSRTVLMHPSMTFRAVLSLARPFMSKPSLDKFVICGSKSPDENLTDCPYLKKNFPGVAAGVIPSIIKGGLHPGDK